METKRIYQMVIVRRDTIDEYDEVLCLSTHSLVNRINQKIEEEQKRGYQTTVFKGHEWQSISDTGGHFKAVRILRKMKHETEYCNIEYQIGYTIYDAV